VRVAVIGAGSWGTAVARHLARQGHDVALWSHNAAAADEINREHTNVRYLPGCTLPVGLRATTSAQDALAGAAAAVLVVPSSHLRAVCRNVAPWVAPELPVAVLTKGIEPDSCKLMTEVATDELGGAGRVAALSGPNHAEEVARDLPAASVIAAADPACGQFFQRLFHSDAFRTYVSDDVVGVEVCAAAKNVVAIACGIARGIGMGDNTCAVLMTRGLAEMGRLVAASGGNPLTCMGLAGMGDLVATCTSAHSRNQTFGAAFAAGETLAQFEERRHMVVEGARACVSVRELARKRGVEVPLADAVYALLYGGVSLADATAALYARVPNDEFYGLTFNGRVE
jgi:glycerol-3-phosphate dehydrogenase (NAD(P)+)